MYPKLELLYENTLNQRNIFKLFFDNMQIDDLKLIIKVAEYGNISAAATHLNMQSATASAAIKRVEKHLGFDLLFAPQ